MKSEHYIGYEPQLRLLISIYTPTNYKYALI